LKLNFSLIKNISAIIGKKNNINSIKSHKNSKIAPTAAYRYTSIIWPILQNPKTTRLKIKNILLKLEFLKVVVSCAMNFSLFC
jgi:hypothetical protein